MKSLFIALSLALLARGALAQVNLPDCTESWQALAAALPVDELHYTGPELDTQGRCRLSDISFQIGTYQRMEIERLSWSGTGLERTVEGQPPEALDLSFEGARAMATIPDQPVLNYLYREQARALQSVSGDLRYHWSPGEPLVLDQLALDFRNGNRITLSAQIAGLDLGSLAALQTSRDSATLSEARLEIYSYGLFETLALVPMGQMMLIPGQAPEAQVETLKTRATAFIGALSQPALDAPSKTALSTLVQSLPHPQGRFAAHLTTVGEGMPLGRLTEGLTSTPKDGLADWLRDLRLTVTWEPKT